MSHEKKYILIWVALLVALFVSLGLGVFVSSKAAITAIFVIAAAKAWLVVSEFMHLRMEPRFLKLVMAGATAAVLCFLVGVYPDVGLAWAVIPAAPRADPEASPPALMADVQSGDPARGAKIYGTYCVGCHGEDGRANGGKTAANFVDDKTRLAKTDLELLTSISEGKTGAIGVMPPWKGALSPQQRADALAYLRATFGAS